MLHLKSIKKAWSIIMLVVCVNTVMAVPTDHNTLRGKVLDIETNEPLAGAHVVLLEQNLSTITNELGDFVLTNVPMGDVNIKIKHIGYKVLSEQLSFTGEEGHTFFLRLQPLPFGINQVTVTATRTANRTINVPAMIETIDATELENHALSNIDDIFHSIANVQVNRSWGIFSKNTSVTMRGLESASRTLIMLNGVPLNQEAGGPVSWHLINPDEVERIEVVKGPGSAVYGNNAMGGAINIITKKPKNKTNLSAKLFYGTYNTFGGNINAGQNLIDEDKGLYYNVDVLFRQGDGYNFNPPELSDETDFPVFLEEHGTGISGGYQLNKHHKIDFNYRYHTDKRGDGKKVYEELGSYFSYTDHFMQASYTGKFLGQNLTANLYNHNEHYFRQNESLNSSSEYRLYETNSYKYDRGLMLNSSKKIGQFQNLTIGLDAKQSGIDAADDYMSSSDSIAYFGTLDYLGYFLQDELSFLNDKLIFNIGVRVDHSRFSNGSLIISNPTSTTGFLQAEDNEYKNSIWSELSPKFAAKYHFTNNFSMYANIAKGFMPPKLDDMCRSGKVTKGFKLANPNLQPESLINYEIGGTYFPIEKLKLAAAAYYSVGSNMVFFVNTGDTVDTGGSSLKPVLQKQNITSAAIKGFEISLEWNPIEPLTFKTNFTHNSTEVLEFIDQATGIDHAGFSLIEVSPNLFFAGVYLKHKWLNGSLTYSFIDEQWVDDLNTQVVDSYSLVDLHLGRSLGKHFNIALDVQNLLDKPYIDRKGRLSPGRFALLSVKYRL